MLPATAPIPSPAVVVLVGASGSGKSTWARSHFAPNEIVSSDALRAVVGSGEADLEASDDAFAVLDAVVAARARRGLTVVVDTLGLDPARRRAYAALARSNGLPAIAVRFTTPPKTCRERNAARDRPVPAAALTGQLRKAGAAGLDADLVAEGFDLVTTAVTTPGVTAVEPAHSPGSAVTRATQAATPTGLRFVLQVSSFPWGGDPRGWLRDVAREAERLGFAGIAVMDHLLQIPQVGRAWDPMPEACTTLGYLAGVTERLELGTLVTPVTFRSAPLHAKAVATLDVLSGGRAFCGIGAGWYAREHAAYDLPFPPAKERLDRLERAIGVLRASWGAGTKPYADLPETTAYPRPLHDVQVIVGGGGERRTLEIAARLGDACNLPSALPVLDHKLAVLRTHCAAVGRDPAEVAVTVLDLPVLGRDRTEVATLVERHRGRQSATAYAAAHHAGTVDDHVGRYRLLADRGVSTVFLALPDLVGPAGLETFGEVVETFRTAPRPPVVRA